MRFFSRKCTGIFKDLNFVSSGIFTRVFFAALRFLNVGRLYPIFYNEKNLSYNSDVVSRKYLYYIGYWQSPLYHLDIYEYIYRTLFVGVDVNYLMDKYSLRKKTLCVHVRKGDYNKSSFYTLLGNDYYSNSLQYAKNNFLFEQIIIVSDDIEWCKRSGYFDKNVIYSDGESELADLYILSSCSSVIIANSSFSWWGAVLGDAKNVIAPISWFTDKSLNSCDRYIKNWILI